MSFQYPQQQHAANRFGGSRPNFSGALGHAYEDQKLGGFGFEARLEPTMGKMEDCARMSMASTECPSIFDGSSSSFFDGSSFGVAPQHFGGGSFGHGPHLGGTAGGLGGLGVGNDIFADLKSMSALAQRASILSGAAAPGFAAAGGANMANVMKGPPGLESECTSTMEAFSPPTPPPAMPPHRLQLQQLGVAPCPPPAMPPPPPPPSAAATVGSGLGGGEAMRPPMPTTTGSTDEGAASNGAEDEDSGEQPSRGSHLHATGECTPCKFFRGRRGCKDGPDCALCHHKHDELTYSGIRRMMRKRGLEKRGIAEGPSASHDADDFATSAAVPPPPAPPLAPAGLCLKPPPGLEAPPAGPPMVPSPWTGMVAPYMGYGVMSC